MTIVVRLPLHPQKFPIYHFTNDCELVPMLSATLQMITLAQAMMKKHKFTQIWARCRFTIYLPNEHDSVNGWMALTWQNVLERVDRQKKMFLLVAEILRKSVWSQYSCTMSKAIKKKVKSYMATKSFPSFNGFGKDCSTLT